MHIFTPPCFEGGYCDTCQLVCLCVCVCLCVGHEGELCKNGSTEQLAVWNKTHVNPSHIVLDWGGGPLKRRGNFGAHISPFVKHREQVNGSRCRLVGRQVWILRTSYWIAVGSPKLGGIWGG